MPRIEGINPADAEARIQRVFEAQIKNWDKPLVNHTIYARRPTIFRGAQSMWSGIRGSGLLDPQLSALINRRVATLNGCEF